MSNTAKKLLIDIGSTYFKVKEENKLEQHFRDFNKDIYDDLTFKCGETIHNYHKDDVFICSSANGGLSTLIIGVTNSFSLKYATNIAFNSGINIIDTVLYQNIDTTSIPSDLIDVVFVVGGINSVENIFDDRLSTYLKKLNYSNLPEKPLSSLSGQQTAQAVFKKCPILSPYMINMRAKASR